MFGRVPTWEVTTVVTNDLTQALSSLGQEFATHSGSNHDAPSLVIQVEGKTRNLHPILRDEVYRIAGEALRNAFRHAQAEHIEAEIHYNQKLLRLRIRDDGKGIDAQFLQGGRTGYSGLGGMRERAKLIGGRLTVWSKLDSGTEVELSIPAGRAYTALGADGRTWFAKKLSWKGVAE